MPDQHPSAIADLARGLSFAIGRANRRMLAAGKGLGQSHLSALATIFRVGSIRPGDLAQKEFVSAPTMTRTLRDLETRGLVTRTADPDDGRSILVAVTPAGEHEVLVARSVRADILAGLIEHLDRDDIAALRDALPAIERLATVDAIQPE